MPSNNPSSVPSISPSISPSNTPSNAPSNVPSNNPSIIPSISPSINPTGEPSDKPSLSPTVSIPEPTIEPTISCNLWTTVPTPHPTPWHTGFTGTGAGATGSTSSVDVNRSMINYNETFTYRFNNDIVFDAPKTALVDCIEKNISVIISSKTEYNAHVTFIFPHFYHLLNYDPIMYYDPLNDTDNNGNDNGNGNGGTGITSDNNGKMFETWMAYPIGVACVGLIIVGVGVWQKYKTNVKDSKKVFVNGDYVHLPML